MLRESCRLEVHWICGLALSQLIIASLFDEWTAALRVRVSVLWDQRCCKGTHRAGRREAGEREMVKLPFGRPGQLMVPGCQTQVLVALGMVQDLQEMKCAVRPLALNPPRHQKAPAGIVFPALKKMLFACGAWEMPSSLTNRLPAHMEAIDQLTEDSLDLSWLCAYFPAFWRTLEGISQTATDALDWRCSREVSCSESEYHVLGTQSLVMPSLEAESLCSFPLTMYLAEKSQVTNNWK